MNEKIDKNISFLFRNSNFMGFRLYLLTTSIPSSIYLNLIYVQRVYNFIKNEIFVRNFEFHAWLEFKYSSIIQSTMTNAILLLDRFTCLSSYGSLVFVISSSGIRFSHLQDNLQMRILSPLSIFWSDRIQELDIVLRHD